MRRLISAVLCFAFAVSLCACGAKQSAGIANPVHESSAEEIMREDGVEIRLPEGAEAPVMVRIVGDAVIDEVTFDYGGERFCYRVQKTDALEDISGIYAQWGEPEGGEPGDNAPRCLVNEGAEGILLWYEQGRSHCISMTEHADGDRLMELYGLMK